MEINVLIVDIFQAPLIKLTAPNWRFGASGGAAPRKVQWEH